MQIETTVRQGLPVTIDFEVFDRCIESFRIVAVNGRHCRKEPSWIKISDDDEARIYEEGEAALFA